jgi:peptidoglycan/LPS O-acetylase OafA/YrhL
LKANNPGYIPTLDGWRAIAILLVLVDHSIFRTFRPYGWTLVGGHGVEIFFILSGYLITGKLLEDDSLPRFYTRRAFRILPILLAYLFVVSVLGFVLHRIPLLRSEVISSALFVRNYFVYLTATSTGVGWFTGHLWSLAIEEQFYLIWPLVLLSVGKGTPRRQALAVTLLFGFWTAIYILVHVARLFHLGGWAWIPHLNYAGLVVGCLLRIAFSDVRAVETINKIFTGRSALVVTILFVYIAMLHAGSTLLDPLFCGLAVCATLVEPNAWVGRMLELPFLRWIGRLSYSLYIWQQLFLAFGETLRPFGFFSQFPINFASLLCVSCLSYYLLERPMMRLGHELTSGRRAVQPAAEARLVA